MPPPKVPSAAPRPNRRRGRARPRARTRRTASPLAWLRRRARLLILLAGVALVAVGVAAYFSTTRFATSRLEGATGMVTLEWPRTTTPTEAAEILAGAGLVRSKARMVLYLEGAGGTEDFVPGQHLLPRGASPQELVALLRRDPERPRSRLVIPEGFHRFAIAKRAEEAGICGREAFLDATADPLLLGELDVPGPDGSSPPSAEGYLFPATYEIAQNTHAPDVVRRLVRESDKRWGELASRHERGIADLAARLQWGRREIVILASIVEKEAAVDEERPRIAGVFLNRLLDPTFQPKRLQSDPTSAYGCLEHPADAPSCAEFEGRITPAMNRDKLNRYSTYAHDALPPGPIANPGESSIAAVLDPEASSFFYFVAAGGGRHHFSETLADHTRAIRGEGAGTAKASP